MCMYLGAPSPQHLSILDTHTSSPCTVVLQEGEQIPDPCQGRGRSLRNSEQTSSLNALPMTWWQVLLCKEHHKEALRPILGGTLHISWGQGGKNCMV